MNITRDRKRGTITIDQKDYTRGILERYGMTSCIPTLTPGVGSELSLNQTEDKLLGASGKQRYQSIDRALMMYLAQVSRYDIFYVVN